MPVVKFRADDLPLYYYLVPNRIIIGRHYLSHFTHDNDRELSPTLTTNFKHRKEQHGSDPFKVHTGFIWCQCLAVVALISAPGSHPPPRPLDKWYGL